MKKLLLSTSVVLALSACVDDAAPSNDPGPSDAGDASISIADGNMGADGDGGCQPSSEICDGVDNDCDGTTDEGFPLGEVCQILTGGCTSTGTWACDDDGTARCDAPMPTPEEELCDEVDNDCDSAIDEEFMLNIDVNHCGACNQACAQPNATMVCDGGNCMMTGCVDGFGDANGDAADGCECDVTGPETCNDIDDDCDGRTDEGLGLDAECTVGVGPCTATGRTICGADGEVECGASPPAPSPELCNGRDDDCDGTADEDFDGDEDGFVACPGLDCEAPCPEGIDCDALCPLFDCNDELASINPRAVDVCEDGVDQNCDGQDSPCVSLASRVDSLALAEEDEAGCRDLDGDGTIDNAFGAPLLVGAANGELATGVRTGQINLMPVAQGLRAGEQNGRFEMAVLIGQRNGQAYDVDPGSLDENGNPVMLFGGANLVDGNFSAGPGDFLLDLPINGQAIQILMQRAMLNGRLTTADEGLTIPEAHVSGVITQEAFNVGLALIPADFRALVGLILMPDLDLDGDGENDAYSACVRLSALPAELRGFPAE